MSGWPATIVLKVEAVAANSALVDLVANTYMNYLLDRSLRSKEFHFLSRLVSRLPVRRVIPHTDPANITGLCEAILKDYAGLLDRSGVAREPVLPPVGAGLNNL